MRNIKKIIKTKDEVELSNLIYFNGKYVDSMIKAAQSQHLVGNSVSELLKHKKQLIKAANLKEAKRFNMYLKQFNNLQIKASNILSDFNTGHSMGCYRQMYINVKHFASNNSLSTYANSCKFKPTYGGVTIYLNKSELTNIQRIEGVWTILGKDSTAKWLQSTGRKNTYSVDWVNGWVYGTTHSTVSLQDAKNGEAIKVANAIKKIKASNRFVGYRHIKLTGACDSGILAYCNRHNLDKNFGYHLGYLKSLEDTRYFDMVS